MPSAETFRSLVAARAGDACEYCRLLEYASGVTFHIEHVVPQSAGGKTLLSNLALSCPGCNLSKSSRVTAPDDLGVSRTLYNPRDYQPAMLGWYLHFALDHESGRILGRTTIGTATVSALKMNDGKRVNARKLQIDAGLLA